MENLLKEYKETRRETTKILNDLQVKYDNLLHSKKSIDDLSYEETTLLHQYDADLTIIRSWISNLNYSIEWIRTGKQPGNITGIENQRIEKREVPFHPYWIQLRKEEDGFSIHESSGDEEKEMIKIVQEQKKNIVSSMTSSLTDRQTEILELVGNGYSHSEIAKLLKVHEGTIKRTLNRVKEKIREEGWFMP